MSSENNSAGEPTPHQQPEQSIMSYTPWCGTCIRLAEQDKKKQEQTERRIMTITYLPSPDWPYDDNVKPLGAVRWVEGNIEDADGKQYLVRRFFDAKDRVIGEFRFAEIVYSTRTVKINLE